MVPLKLVTSKNLELALQAFYYFNDNPEKVLYGEIKKDELIDFIKDVTNEEDMRKAVPILRELYVKKLEEENKPVPLPEQLSVTVPINTKDLVAALNQYLVDKKEQTRIYDEFVRSFEKREEAVVRAMKMEDEIRLRQMLKQNETDFREDVIRRVQKQRKLNREQADQLIQTEIKNLQALTPEFEAKVTAKLKKPIKIVPEEERVPIVLTPEEVKVLDEEIQELTQNKETFIREQAKQVANNLQSSGLTTNLTDQQIDQVSQAIVRDNVDKLEPLARQLEGKTEGARQELLSEIMPPPNPIALTGPAANPQSPIYSDIPNAEEIAQKIEIERTRAAIEEDFARAGLKDYGSNTLNALRGDPLEKFRPVETEEEQKQSFNFKINDALNLYEKFFGGQDVVITSTETALQLSESQIIPLVFDTSVGAYTGLSITSSIVAEASSHAIAMPIFTPRLLQISNAFLPTTSFALPTATGVTISEGVVGNLVGYFSIGGAEGVPVFLITGGQAGTTLLAEGASTFYLGAPQTIAALAEGGAAQLSTELFAGGLTSATGLGVEAGAAAATAVGGTELAVAGTGAATTAAASTVTATTGALGALAGFIATPLGALIAGLVVTKLLPLLKKIFPYVSGAIGAIAFGVPFGAAGILLGGAGGFVLGGGVVTGSIAGGIAIGSAALAALGSAFATAIALPLVAALVGIPVAVALILFIINSGAYVVPPGISPGATSIICKAASGNSQTTGSAVANDAICIVSYLNEFNLNPLFANMVNTPSWQNLANVLAKPATDALASSAQGTGKLQCVGFIAATAGLAYGQSFTQIDACGYISHPPAGYTYTAGTAGIQAGDFFVINGTGGCDVPPNPSPGHVGVVTSVDGVIISCADANRDFDGAARTTHGCFALSQLTGYLRKQ